MQGIITNQDLLKVILKGEVHVKARVKSKGVFSWQMQLTAN